MAGLSRNAPCPCGSGRKYKHCCLGKVDWDAIERGRGDRYQHLSVRGRNLAFYDLLAEIFLLDSRRQLRLLDEYKRAFTVENVRKIHEGLVRIWPKNLDVQAALSSAGGGVSGLYIGDYSADHLLRGLVRHSAYATKLMVCDPFMYPPSVRPEYSPIENPEQHRVQTLRNANLWQQLLPWVEAGIVNVIRTPCDFDHKLKWDSLRHQQEKFEKSEELAAAAKVSVEEMRRRHLEAWKFRDLVLTAPDGYLLEKFHRAVPAGGTVTKEDLLAYVQRLRAQDPDFLEPLGPGLDGQLQMVTSGASYDIACLISEMTGCHLITDLSVKWKEIEVDRRGRTAEVEAWSPFAKALHEASLKYLDAISLEDALSLREHGRLESIRAFLRRVWTQACEPGSYSPTNAQLLADELDGQIRLANEEWQQIDRELLKYTGGAGAGLVTSGTLLGTGQGEFLAAASMVAGAAALAASAWQRRGFADRFPAAFYLRLGG